MVKERKVFHHSLLTLYALCFDAVWCCRRTLPQLSAVAKCFMSPFPVRPHHVLHPISLSSVSSVFIVLRIFIFCRVLHFTCNWAEPAGIGHWSGWLTIILQCYDTVGGFIQSRWILTTQAWKQASGNPGGQTWNYRGITLLYNFTTALLYMVSSVTMARIVAMLLNIY